MGTPSAPDGCSQGSRAYIESADFEGNLYKRPHKIGRNPAPWGGVPLPYKTWGKTYI